MSLSLRSGSQNQMPMTTKSGRIKDWLLYLFIAVLVVTSLWLFAIHQAQTGSSAGLPLKWMGFVGMSAIVFGGAIRDSRQLWTRRRFWISITIFLALHCGLWIILLLRAPVVPMLLYAMWTGPEYLLLAAYLGYFADS